LSDEILQIPQLPPGLKEAALRGRLIPFVGAGASMIAGCPSWSEFADRTLRFFIEQGKCEFRGNPDSDSEEKPDGIPR